MKTKIVKYAKFLLIISIMLITQFGGSVLAFNNQLGTILHTQEGRTPEGTIWGQTYKYDSTNGTALFCTAYMNDAGNQCTLSNDWSEPLRAAVAKIINEANFENKTIDYANSNNNYLVRNLQLTLAVNALLYNKVYSGNPYVVRKSDGTYDNPYNYLTQEFKGYYNDALTEYDRVNKIENPSGDNRYEITVERTSGSSNYVYTPTGPNNNPVFTYHVKNMGTNQSDFKVSIAKAGAALPADVILRVSISDQSNFSNILYTNDFTGTVNNRINSDNSVANLTDLYIKVELVDNRADKTQEFDLYFTINAAGKVNYSVARNYNCGVNKQTLTPNATEPKNKKYSDFKSGSITYVAEPEYPQLEILKVEKNHSENKLENARFKITFGDDTDENEQKVYGNTNSEGIYIYNDISDKKYCVKETRAAQGYKLNPEEHCFTVTKTLNGSEWVVDVDRGNDSAIIFDRSSNLIVVTVADEPNIVTIDKVNINREPVPGATLKLTNRKDPSADAIETWQTDGTAKEFTGLSRGMYYVYETSAPDGYVLNNVPVSFRIDGTETETINVEFVDDKTNVKIAKVDENKQRLDGARLKITDEQGNVIVEPWETLETRDKVITGVLNINTIYYLEEVEPKSGYAKADRIKFKLNSQGYVQILEGEDTDSPTTVYLTNVKNSLKIDKRDSETGNSLTGAHLQLLDETGTQIIKVNISDSNVVTPSENGRDYWITNGSEVTIEGLPAGTYRIHELHVPDGYKLSKNDIVFTVAENGTITIEGEEPNNSLIIVPNTKNQFQISKRDITGTKEVAHAMLTIYVGDTDEIAKTVDGTPLTWESGTEPYIVKGLKTGTYRLVETQAPDGYIINTEEIVFTLDHQGNIKVNNKLQESNTLIMTNDQTKVYISKQDITTKEELPGAELVLKNEAGFELHRWFSTTEPEPIEGLAKGTYTITEITAPDGYQLNEETITFTMDENGSITGDTIMYNTPIPDVPNTLSTQSLIITIAGLIIIGGGVGLYIYGIKKKKEI